MPHYATLNDYQFKDRLDDLRGWSLFGVDNEKLGTIDDVIFEHGSGQIKYAVVDTGGWLSSHKFLVPAERIHTYDRDPKALQVDLRKEHIERYFPPYDAKTVERDEDWRDYEGRYNRAVDDNKVFDSGPVLHKRGSTHMLTPEASELPATGGGEDLSGLDLEPQRIASKFPEAMPGGGKLQMAPAGTPSHETSGWSEHVGAQPGDVESRSMRHRHAEGKVEAISSSPEFRPADVKAPMGSMGEDIQPLADPDAQAKLMHPPEIEVGARRAGQTGGSQGELVGDRRELRNVGDPAAASQGSERWARFEDLLRRNRVDIEAKCPQCAPAKDRKTA